MLNEVENIEPFCADLAAAQSTTPTSLPLCESRFPPQKSPWPKPRGRPASSSSSRAASERTSRVLAEPQTFAEDLGVANERLTIGARSRCCPVEGDEELDAVGTKWAGRRRSTCSRSQPIAIVSGSTMKLSLKPNDRPGRPFFQEFP
jgi:hypothetical protein